MLFSGDNYAKVLDGRKTQTRRPVGEEEVFLINASRGVKGVFDASFLPFRPKWIIDKTYAVQPGRGIVSGGRIRITAIRQAWLQDISWEDAIAEGVEEQDAWGHAVEIFAMLWDAIYGKRAGLRWDANPDVWALEFHMVQAEAEA